MSAATAIKSVTSPNGTSTTTKPFASREATTFWRIPHGTPGKTEGRRKAAQVIAHERDVGRVQRDLAAGGPHRHADACGREGRRVVYPVADHGDGAARLLEIAHARELLL